jgi:hypothetical protein
MRMNKARYLFIFFIDYFKDNQAKVKKDKYPNKSIVVHGCPYKHAKDQDFYCSYHVIKTSINQVFPAFRNVTIPIIPIPSFRLFCTNLGLHPYRVAYSCTVIILVCTEFSFNFVFNFLIFKVHE